MARTCRTARKSTGRLHVGQLAPQNVPQPQESQPDVPQEASPEVEPFEIELVVPESPTAQDLPAEEQQQPEDHDIETRPMKSTLPRVILKPRRCTEMLTRSSPLELNPRLSPADFGLCWSTWASQRCSSDPGFSADTRDRPSGLHTTMLLPMLLGRPSHRGSVATRAGCRTRSTTSCPTGRRINSRPMG
jgi:hypothetical protein